LDWESIDERLIKRGELLLSLEFLESYDRDLKSMNIGKVGRPYTLTERYVEFLSVVRYLFAFPYRQLEGFTRALHTLVPKFPSADYSGLRRRILDLDFPLCEPPRSSDEPVIVAVDSTGVSVHKSEGWVERRHGKKKRYVKIHLAVDVETKDALAMIVTTDGTHDSRVFPELLRKAERSGKVSKVIADGAYDSSKVYKLLEHKGVEAVIKPRRNSRLDTPSEPRRKAVTAYTRLGHRRWTRLKGYGKRWSVETAYSTFKRAFGEYCMAKTMKNITRELAAKAFIYNTLINL